MSLTELRKYGMGFLLIALLLFVICGCGNVGEEGGGEEDDRCRDRRVPSLQLHRREWKEFRHRCRARAGGFFARAQPQHAQGEDDDGANHPQPRRGKGVGAVELDGNGVLDGRGAGHGRHGEGE